MHAVLTRVAMFYFFFGALSSSASTIVQYCILSPMTLRSDSHTVLHVTVTACVAALAVGRAFSDSILQDTALHVHLLFTDSVQARMQITCGVQVYCFCPWVLLSKAHVGCRCTDFVHE
jgi:hypothetical protein